MIIKNTCNTAINQRTTINPRTTINTAIFLILFAFILVIFTISGCQRKVTDHDPVDTMVTEGIMEAPGLAGGDLYSGNPETANSSSGIDSRDLTGDDTSLESPESINRTGSLSDKEEEYYIYVTGAVNNPGVYIAKPGDRVYSVIDAAGGLREDACDTWINQAQKLDDGLMINIPTMEEARALSGDDANNYGAVERGVINHGNINGVTTAQGNLSQNSANQGNNELVNINTADAQALSTLPGIGKTKAEAIITYREETGGFTTLEQIMEVSGIGESSFNKIKGFICI